MAYISIEAPRNTAETNVGRWFEKLATWLKSAFAKPTAHYPDPYNEHLLRDAGIERPELLNVSGWDHNQALTTSMLHTPMGNNISFIDLYVHEHRQHRAPRV